jgi:hypothetical protein
MITANKLSKLSVKVRELENVIKEHLYIIDEKMLKADKNWGRNVIAHELPTIFVIPGIDRKDSQRMVYSSILKNLQKRGFTVRILIEAKKTIIYISWICEYSYDELESMDAVIRDTRILSNEVEEFMNQKNIN